MELNTIVNVKKKWTEDEDRLLLETTEDLDVIDFKEVANTLGTGRTEAQVRSCAVPWYIDKTHKMSGSKPILSPDEEGQPHDGFRRFSNTETHPPCAVSTTHRWTEQARTASSIAAAWYLPPHPAGPCASAGGGTDTVSWTPDPDPRSAAHRIEGVSTSSGVAPDDRPCAMVLGCSATRLRCNNCTADRSRCTIVV